MSGRKQFDVDQALDRAMEVFWAHSYADATLELLASATGLGRGSLYGTFGSKDELFQRSIERYASIYGAQYDQAMAAHTDDPVRAIEAFFATVIKRIGDPAVPVGCLIAQSAIEAPELGEGSRTAVRKLLENQTHRIRKTLAATGASTQTVAGLAIFVVAVNQSLAVLSRAAMSRRELETVAAVAVRAVSDRLASNTITPV